MTSYTVFLQVCQVILDHVEYSLILVQPKVMLYLKMGVEIIYCEQELRKSTRRTNVF